MAYGPIKVHKIKNKCLIIKDYDADFTIVDPNLTHIITNAEQASNLLGRHMTEKIKGMPIMTVIRGHIVMREGELISKITAELIEFDI